MEIKPMNDRVLIAQNAKQETTESGIILEGTRGTGEITKATVLAVGPDVKEVKLQDDIKVEEQPVVETKEDIPVLENEEMWASRVIDESQTELPEIKVDEASKEWEPELYKRRELGRYQQEIGATPPKTTSFLNKVSSLFSQKTIEKEVDNSDIVISEGETDVMSVDKKTKDLLEAKLARLKASRDKSNLPEDPQIGKTDDCNS